MARVRAQDRIQLSDGTVMSLAAALDTGRVGIRRWETPRPHYTAWERCANGTWGDVGWDIGATLAHARLGLPVPMKRRV